MADTSIMKQIADKIKDSNNILVTVNSNPSVDELSAALGVTLFINKLNKHATAIFSGEVPPAIEFLNPEKTFEHTVDSLRDFIIALDKEKADHLRYKVVDDMVKIFITPYRTTISEQDLNFSQGDYNVEMVLAIGVQTEADLDHALESHGRIMHDATVAAISLGEPTKLGGMEWADGSASSYSEMVVRLVEGLKTDKATIDEQIANAFLTGIVAATDRFSNSSTNSQVMTIAAQLMAAGANQQLIANELQKKQEISAPSIAKTESKTSDTKEEPKQEDDTIGALSISHVPEGDVDEVAKQVSEHNTEQALTTATQELAEVQAAPAPVDATDAAEHKLAEQLAAAAPAAGAPMAAAGLSDATPALAPQPLRGAVSVDQWKAHTDEMTAEPSLGGTLNATTEQAADDVRKSVEDDRNKTILSHGSYVASAPSFQAPLNAAVASDLEEPQVPDVLSQAAETEVTAHIDAIQPPAPAVHTPTLAEIDAQNRAHDDARDAISQALGAPAPTTVTAADGLPPLPPMPDFSTLPPLPPELTPPSSPSQPAPSSPAGAPAVQPTDPSQFRIPGQ